MSNELTQRIAQEHAAAAESLPSGVVARARRRRAIDALLASGLPTSRDENWRYASLRPLERVRFAPAPARLDLAAEPLPAPVPGYARYVFLDGRFAADSSGPVTPRPGLTVETLSRSSAASPLPVEADEPSLDTAFALLNDAFAMDGVRIEVAAPGEAALSKAALGKAALGETAAAGDPDCIEVVFVASAPAQLGASYPRLRVEAAPHTRLRLIERHVSLGEEPSFVDAAVEVRVRDGAAVDHYRVQQLGARAVWMDTLHASVERSAAYRLHTIGLGAQSARSTLHVHLRGPGAELALHAVAVGDRQQVLDTYAVVEHAAAHTRTEESFRGIAAGRSRVAFNGKIIVRPGAQGADSSQSLRGLLAGLQAEIDVRPQLEIYTDDVRCSHGATAGKLDETMLFYLLSRGLERDTAQRLLKWAFLEDVVSKIAVAALRRQIEESLAGQLEESDVLKEIL